ncbi:CAP domain-containing protein [Streptomyces sp. PU-14G]|uniref:CAP domain-containing protein n=1 Tax=Streptomyces sp. PU-14G TaxID=2800808 RepID=UPI0034DFC0D9
MSADERELIALLNERRPAALLPQGEESGALASQAEPCSSASLAKGALAHCGHEVLFMGGSGTRPEAMLEAWFNSPGHKTALTYGSSTKAGAGIVTDDSGRLVTALTIDYWAAGDRGPDEVLAPAERSPGGETDLAPPPSHRVAASPEVSPVRPPRRA